ncbi:MAG: ATP-binding cassette domain-containing protein, partial [Eubacteriales bacterium]|nr:ATP-binding cassette domain-containing protein [Eubacteriales bacterium]
GDIEKITGDIELRDVTFKYPDGEVNVLEHFSLKIPHGTTTAIVGETGAGKSTLVNLICRFYEPTDGSIFLDGRDIRERTQYWLHRHIGYVLQSPQLFDDTVRENLRFGAPEATDEEIMEALRRVNAVNVIDRLDGGLDAGVGEGGNLLSVGEKQLISFARALLSDPDILVLDEATSSIDTITEKKLQSAISELTKGRTCFIIAHRLSTIRHADKIIVMRDGCIVETGTHKELIKKHGYYEELYKQQSTEAVLELPD